MKSVKEGKEPGEKHRLEPYFNFLGRKFFNHTQPTKLHNIVLFSIFILLLLVKGFFDKIPILYGEGLHWYGKDPGAIYVTVGSIFLLIYGAYLVFVSCLNFNQLYSNWKNNKLAKNELAKSYGKVFLYSFYLFLISSGIIGFFSGLIYHTRAFLDNSLVYYLLSDFGIFFPISLYTIFLSIKSLIFAKKQILSYRFGIILLVISIILLLLSIPAFVFIYQFWIQSGGQFYI